MHRAGHGQANALKFRKTTRIQNFFVNSIRRNLGVGQNSKVTLVYAAKDENHNNAIVLRAILARRA
jgi:uncharacterized protein YeaO (DUF488 family)